MSNYAPQPKWCDDLVRSEKITREVYARYVARCTVACSGRLRNKKDAIQYDESQLVARMKREADAILDPLLRPSVEIPQIQE